MEGFDPADVVEVDGVEQTRTGSPCFGVVLNFDDLLSILEDLPNPSTIRKNAEMSCTRNLSLVLIKEDSYSMPADWIRTPNFITTDSEGGDASVEMEIPIIMLDPAPTYCYWLQIDGGYVAVKLVESDPDKLAKFGPHMIEHLAGGAVILGIDRFVRKNLELAEPPQANNAMMFVEKEAKKKIQKLSRRELQNQLTRMISPDVLTLAGESSWGAWANLAVNFPSPANLNSAVGFYYRVAQMGYHY